MIKNLIWLLLGATIVVSCGGDQINTTTSDGWQDLFNGADLTGWTRLNGDADYTVEDSVIVGTTKKGAPTTFLATDKKFGNFALQFDVQIDTFINSGVQVRSNSTDYMSGKVHGYQVEVDPSKSRGWSGGIYDQNRRGWLFPMDLNPTAKKAFKPMEWNSFYVECIGSEIKTWVNDVPATFLIDDMTLTGFVALQIHSVDHAQLNGRKIRWKNIRINENPKERKSGDFPYVNNTEVNNLSDAEKELGWHFLFNGESTENWRGAHSQEFPANWTVKDGELILKESGGQQAAQGGDIVTKDEYASFDLQVDFKLSKGANSGIKYFVTEDYDSKQSAIGLEYQILDDTEHPDAKEGVEGNRTLASLYDLIPADKPYRFVRPPGEWNRARIVVTPNNMVEHWLNYVKVLEYKRGSAAFKRLVDLSKYKDYKGFGIAPKGHILLQDHGNEVSFRNIKIRNLQ